jgi:uncharacterized protein YuzE
MKIDFDVEADAVYVQLLASDLYEFQEISPGIIADFNANGEMVGLEILSLRRKLPHQIMSLAIPFQDNIDRQTFERFVLEHGAKVVTSA